jgi:hypothetical protein
METFWSITVQVSIGLFVASCIIGTSLMIVGGAFRIASWALIETLQIRKVMKRDNVGLIKACATERELERNYEARITEAQQKISQLQQRLTEANSERKEKYEEWYYHYEILSGAVNSVSKEIEALKQILSVNASSCKIEVDLAPLERTALALLTYLEPYKVELSKEGKDLVEAMNPKK